ncbi:MAG: hypothetical protein HQ541_20785, partial [Mariniphaga sp.]|nr:hypothetical protein [Mariniphaga sp.]
MSAVITLLIIALYLLSQNSSVQRYLTEKIANKLSEQLNTEFHVGGVDITLFNKLVLKEVWMEDNNLDTLFYVNRLVADIDSFSVRKKYIAINNITFNTSRLFLLIDSTGEYNYQFPENINTDNNRRTQKWNISCNNFDFEQSNFSFGKGVFNLKKNEFFTDINLSISDLSINGDSISTNLDNLSFKYTNNLEIKNLSASIEANPEKINIERINLNTIKSSVVNANLEIALEDSSTNFSDLNINLTVGQSYLNMKDISIFIPSLRGMDDVFEFSGRIFGNPMDLKGRNIIFKTGENTLINCNFYANDISDLNDIYLFFDLSLLQTTFSDLSKLQFPLSSQIQNLSFPESFYNAGILTYKGNFTGFLSNFVAYGKLESEMGNISTDLSFLPGEAGNLKLDGKLTTTEFKVGELFNKKDFNKISFDSEINGEYNKDLNYLQGTFNGEISSFDVFGYNYKNININGLFENKNFDGFINIDGPNLKLDFLGKLHFNPQIPEFDFELSVRNADLVALKLDSIHKISDLAFIGKANFKGNSIDNLNGFINIENGSYLNSNGELTIQDMGIKTKASENNKTITFNSDFLDLEIDGQYNLKTLPLTFKYLLSKYLPVLSPDTSLLTDYQNNFKYIAEFKNLDKLTTVFKPDITILTPFSFEGEFDTRNNLLNLFGDIPGISTEKIIIKDISVRAKTNDSFNTNIKFGQVQSISGLNLY